MPSFRYSFFALPSPASSRFASASVTSRRERNCVPPWASPVRSFCTVPASQSSCSTKSAFRSIWGSAIETSPGTECGESSVYGLFATLVTPLPGGVVHRQLALGLELVEDRLAVLVRPAAGQDRQQRVGLRRPHHRPLVRPAELVLGRLRPLQERRDVVVHLRPVADD